MGGIIALFTGIFLYLCYIADAVSVPLFLIFMILKLCGVITWSWVLVFLPLICLPILILVTLGLVYLSAWLYERAYGSLD